MVELESRYMAGQWIGTLNYSDESLATGKFLFIVPIWRRRMEGEWVTGTSTNELVCRPIYNWHKNCTTLSFSQQKSLNLRVKDGTKYETIVKIKDMLLPNYWVMNMYNITGIRPFRESRANCDRWPIYTDGQIHRFFCIWNLFLGTEHKSDKRRSEKLEFRLSFGSSESLLSEPASLLWNYASKFGVGSISALLQPPLGSFMFHIAKYLTWVGGGG